MPKTFNTTVETCYFLISLTHVQHFNEKETPTWKNIVTSDEKWMHPLHTWDQMIFNGMQECDIITDKEFKAAPTAGKFMTIVFCDAQSLFYLKFMEIGTIIA